MMSKIMTQDLTIDSITKPDALEIIEYLKGGIVGTIPYAAHYLHVDREYVLDKIQEALAATCDGKYFKGYLNADIGSGKTILLRKTEHMALQQNYLVSYVSLAASDIRFNLLETVYHHIMLNLEDRHGNKSTGVLTRIFEMLKLGPNTMHKLLHPELIDSFRAAKTSRNSNEQIRAMANWLQGGREVPWTIRQDFKVRGFIERETCMGYLSDLCHLIRCSGYSGLVILMDELEAISKLNNINFRTQGYLNLQEIHNNKWNFEGCYILFAGTPYFFSGDSGIGEQPQVKRRIEPNMFALEPLSNTSLAELVGRITTLFNIVRGTYPTQAFINEIIYNATNSYNDGRGSSHLDATSSLF